VNPISRTWDGDPDDEVALLTFAVSLNEKRRHMDTSARAVIARRIAERLRMTPQQAGAVRHSPKSAEGSQHEGHLNRREMKANAVRAAKASGLETHGVEADHGKTGGRAHEKAAKMMNVGAPAVSEAIRVRDKGTPALNAALEAGKIKVKPAAAIAALPAHQQDAALAAHLEKKAAGRKKPEPVSQPVSQPEDTMGEAERRRAQNIVRSLMVFTDAVRLAGGPEAASAASYVRTG
jgi:hypothetical protein